MSHGLPRQQERKRVVPADEPAAIGEIPRRWDTCWRVAEGYAASPRLCDVPQDQKMAGNLPRQMASRIHGHIDTLLSLQIWSEAQEQQRPCSALLCWTWSQPQLVGRTTTWSGWWDTDEVPMRSLLAHPRLPSLPSSFSPFVSPSRVQLRTCPTETAHSHHGVT